VGVIQREIERTGVATVSISLVKEFTQVVRPPRALWAPFPFGRPLGAPKNAAIQRRVMMAAFALLERKVGPVLEDFVLGDEEQALDAANQTMGRGCGPKGCSLDDILAAGDASSTEDRTPVIQRYDGDLEKVKAEILELAPAHRQYRQNNQGRTQVGSSGATAETVSRAAEVVHAFVSRESPTVPAGGDKPMSTALFVRLSIDDLKAYYLESKSDLSTDKTLDAADANDWFWLETHAGRLIIAARDRIVETTDRSKDPNWILARSIVPRGYGSSGYTMTHVPGTSSVDDV
jgi:hypothetical protein